MPIIFKAFAIFASATATFAAPEPVRLYTSRVDNAPDATDAAAKEG
jgi:hypothetical protein